MYVCMYIFGSENRKNLIREAKEDTIIWIFLIGPILLTEKYYDYIWVYIPINKWFPFVVD